MAQLPPRAGWSSLMLWPSSGLQVKSFVARLPLLLPRACQWPRSFAGAILSHFQAVSEAGLWQSRRGSAATPGTPQGPASSALHGVSQERARGRSSTLEQHSHCTPCLCAALAGSCQQHIGYPHKGGRVPSLVLFRCLLGGLLSKMALTCDPAADGVTVALADCHSHPVSSLTFSFLYNVGNPAPGFEFLLFSPLPPSPPAPSFLVPLAGTAPWL